MKKITAGLALALILVGALAQTVPPELFARKFDILTATATGAGSAVRSTGKPKTYMATASVVSGTGTAVVTVSGSNDGVVFDSNPLGTITISLTSTPAGGGFPSLDSYQFLKGNVVTLSGSTPTVTISAGYQQ